MHEFVIAKDGKPVGTVEDGDSVILYNFRGDRALEITSAFESGADFPHFDRKRVPACEYAGMMEYDGDAHVPHQYLVNPPTIDRTMGEYLTKTGIKLLAISETQKYGHVTYFFNGNKSGKFDEKLEDYVEIPSDTVPFEQRPWMKCAEITDKVVEAIKSGKYDHIRLNYPNGDMVGHTGVFNAVCCKPVKILHFRSLNSISFFIFTVTNAVHNYKNNRTAAAFPIWIFFQSMHCICHLYLPLLRF